VPRRLIIFDWDGTLMDSAARIVNCFVAAAHEVGLEPPADTAIRHIIGLGLEEAVVALFPTADPAQRRAAVDSYREHFIHRDTTGMTFFPGVESGLACLRQQGYLLAVATGKTRRGLQRALDETGAGRFFTATRCVDEALSKPHPQMLLDLLAMTGTGPADALMVGDTEYDMEMARNADVAGLAVSYGVHTREQLMRHEPLDCLRSFTAVCEWLRR
jgi:phosphoglycolate phosphatase